MGWNKEQRRKWLAIPGNLEKRRAWTRNWFRKNRAFNCEKTKKWARLHPDKAKFYNLRTRSRKEGMLFVITLAEFCDWYMRQEQKCAYCDKVDLAYERTSKNFKLNGFTVDRKDSDFPYSLENICFSCWTCNRLKSNIFNHDEWREIAQKYLKPKWMAKIGVSHE